MKRRVASCPGCGAPVSFGIGSVVAVCEFCNTAVARSDKGVEDYGKVADLAETSTPLQRGMSGTLNKRSFTIVGRVQYRHPAGGVWDEWYLSYPNGEWAWLAEAQGNFYVTREKKLKKDAALPDFDSLSVGDTVKLGGAPFDVYERGVATCISGEGEIPWAFRSGAEHKFADLRDEKQRFATLEYSPKTRVFIGHQVQLDDLHLQGMELQGEPAAIATESKQLNCPNCGGPLELRVPDQSLRVTCPNCNSLLDADQGKLSYLKTLNTKERIPISIKLGTEGTLFGNKYTVIGYMRRYATWQGKIFPWNEYLLHSPSVGFRWLVQNDKHWSFVEPASKQVSPRLGSKRSFTLNGDNFRLYDKGVAYVKYVLGEFYWKVEVGERTRTADFIAPPHMISFEWSGTKISEECNISTGRYMTVDEIESAFKLRNLARPWGVGVIQPGPWPGGAMFALWPAFIVLLIVIHLMFAKASVREGSDGWLCFYAILMVSAVPIGFLVYRYSFEVNRWKDSDYSPYATE